MKAQSHSIPPRFLPVGNGKYHVNYNIVEDEMEQPEGDPVTVYLYDYVKVDKLTRDNVINAVIRDKYTQDQVEAIMNNFIDCNEVDEFLRMQNYREYAKAIADDATQEQIETIQAAICYKVTLPLNETMPDGDYNVLAERISRMKVPYLVDAVNNLATVYPGWISADDMLVLENDPRVIIETITLFN